MMIKGIDVSSNNGIVDWELVKKLGYKFAIIRLGFGNDDVSQDDKQFLTNVRRCEELGIPYGVYLYSYAINVEEAKSEANHTLRLLKNVGNNFKYGVWFDMEDADHYKRKKGMPTNNMLVEICKTYCEIIEQKGYYAGIYASYSWLLNQLNDTRLDRYDKWVAHWISGKTPYQKQYSIHQYTDRENIGGKIFDCNYLINDFSNNSKNDKPIPSSDVTGDITYQSYDNVKKCWLPEVINDKDYAGNLGNSLGGVRAKCKYGDIIIESHVLGGDWLSSINSKTYAKNSNNGNSYSGILGKRLDMVRISSTKGYVEYRTHAKGGAWFDWVDSRTKTGSESYAGVKGVEIDAIQMR